MITKKNYLAMDDKGTSVNQIRTKWNLFHLFVFLNIHILFFCVKTIDAFFFYYFSLKYGNC